MAFYKPPIVSIKGPDPSSLVVRSGYALVNRELIQKTIKDTRNGVRNAVDGVSTSDRIRESNLDVSYTNTRGIFAVKNDPQQYMLFQFNPEEITDVKSTTYEDKVKTGFDKVDYVWISGGPRTISFRLFLDATAGSQVKHLGRSGVVGSAVDSFTHDPDAGILKQVQFLQSFQRPFVAGQGYSADNRINLEPRFIRGQAKQGVPFANPSEIIFSYGAFYFEGVMQDLNITYQLWNRQLIPLRGEAQITLRVREGVVLNTDPSISRLQRDLYSVGPPNLTQQ